MEKKFENGMVDALDQATLNEVQKTIETMVIDKGYQLSMPIPKVGPKGSDSRLGVFTDAVSNVVNGVTLKIPKDISLSKEKHLRRLAARVMQRPSMKSASMYLHFLYGTILGQEKTPKVKYSEKEEKIKKARKAWKAAEAISEKLRLEYKAEKGSYYKRQVAVAA
jgi:hypothetical protein